MNNKLILAANVLEKIYMVVLYSQISDWPIIVSIIYPKLPDDGMNNDPDGLRTRHEGAS